MPPKPLPDQGGWDYEGRVVEAMSRLQQERDEAQAEVARLREVLTTVQGWLDGDPDRWVPTAQQYIEAVLNPPASDEEER